MPGCMSVELTPCQAPQLPQHMEAAGEVRTWSPHRDFWLFQSKNSSIKQQEKLFARKEPIASYTPCNQSSFLQLPGHRGTKGRCQRGQPQAGVSFSAHLGGHKCVHVPGEEERLPELKVWFSWVTHFLHTSFLSEMLREIFLKKFRQWQVSSSRDLNTMYLSFQETSNLYRGLNRCKTRL